MKDQEREILNSICDNDHEVELLLKLMELERNHEISGNNRGKYDKIKDLVFNK